MSKDSENAPEEWKAIPGYEGFYEASSFGRIRSLPRSVKTRHGGIAKKNGRILKPSKNSCGYVNYGLSKNGSQKTCSGHILVATAFLGDKPVGFVVDHIDRDKSNNCLKNLEYVSSAENVWRGELGKLRSSRWSKHRFVSFNKRTGKWLAQIRRNGKFLRSQNLDTEEEAVRESKRLLGMI